MVKNYSLKKDGDRTLSKHFKVNEFKSHYNGKVQTDEILIDDILVTKLEELIAYINAKKAVITSGYRCLETDTLVTGVKSKGTSQHCKGKAVDIIFYDSSNKPIDTKYISCIAQDLGFGGIARISDRAIHLDVRTGNRYLGDEMTGHTRTVTTDFYKYYNISKDNVPLKKATEKLNKKNIIDSPDYWYKRGLEDKNIASLLIKFSDFVK